MAISGGEEALVFFSGECATCTRMTSTTINVKFCGPRVN